MPDKEQHSTVQPAAHRVLAPHPPETAPADGRVIRGMPVILTTAEERDLWLSDAIKSNRTIAGVTYSTERALGTEGFDQRLVVEFSGACSRIMPLDAAFGSLPYLHVTHSPNPKDLPLLMARKGWEKVWLHSLKRVGWCVCRRTSATNEEFTATGRGRLLESRRCGLPRGDGVDAFAQQL